MYVLGGRVSHLNTCTIQETVHKLDMARKGKANKKKNRKRSVLCMQFHSISLSVPLCLLVCCWLLSVNVHRDDYITKGVRRKRQSESNMLFTCWS